MKMNKRMLSKLATVALDIAVYNLYHGIGTQKDVTKLILGYSIISDLVIISKEATPDDVKGCIEFKHCLKRIYKRSTNKGRGSSGTWFSPFITVSEFCTLKLLVHNVDNIAKTKCKL